MILWEMRIGHEYFLLKISRPLHGQYTILDILFRYAHKISQKIFRLGPNPILNPTRLVSLRLPIPPSPRTDNSLRQMTICLCESLREMEESDLRQRFWRPQLYHLTNLPKTFRLQNVRANSFY